VILGSKYGDYAKHYLLGDYLLLSDSNFPTFNPYGRTNMLHLISDPEYDESMVPWKVTKPLPDYTAHS
jgi:hypothetical protein